MDLLLRTKSGQLTPVDQRPGWSLIVPAMAQEKARELLAGLAQGPQRRQAGPDQGAHVLMGRIRNPDGGEFAGPGDNNSIFNDPGQLLPQPKSVRSVASGFVCPSASSQHQIGVERSKGLAILMPTTVSMARTRLSYLPCWY